MSGESRNTWSSAARTKFRAELPGTFVSQSGLFAGSASWSPWKPGRAGALVRLDDELDVRCREVGHVEATQDQVRRHGARRIAWEGVRSARVHLLEPCSGGAVARRVVRQGHTALVVARPDLELPKRRETAVRRDDVGADLDVADADGVRSAQVDLSPACRPPRGCRPVLPVPASPVKLSAVANHLVASVSSIRFPRVVPSPVAVAPEAEDAQFRGKVILIVLVSPDRNRWLNRTCP